MTDINYDYVARIVPETTATFLVENVPLNSYIIEGAVDVYTGEDGVTYIIEN